MIRIIHFVMLPVCIPSMSVFDLSYTKLFTCDMGQLIPVMVDELFREIFLRSVISLLFVCNLWLRQCSMRLMPMCIIFLFHIVCFGTNGKILSLVV